MLRSLFISRVRLKVLQTLLKKPRELYHIRGLVRMTGEEINAVRRELRRLESAGILKKEPRGNRIYYWVDPDMVYYNDLLSMVTKSTGLGRAIIKNSVKLGKLKYVMMSGRFVRGMERDENDEVDLLVVGDVVLPELTSLVRDAESKRGKEINYTVMDRNEFEFRKKRRDPFILSILMGSRVMILGDETEMVARPKEEE